MLKKSLIPTQLIPDKERRSLEILPPLSPRGRIFAIVRALFGFFARSMWLLVTGRATSKRMGVLTRVLLQELGFLWVKVGQLLSLRRDLLGEEFCKEVSKLQSRAPGFPPKMSVETIESELGKPITDLFDDFDEDPFAAASIGQVHFATLKGGTKVAVKVRRPFAEEIFKKDMFFIRAFIGTIEFFGILSFMRWGEALWELEEIMAEEVDYRYELANMQRMRKSLKPHKIYVPKAFKKLCTRRVLTMEFVYGVLMSDYIEIHNTDPDRLEKWRDENKVKPKKVGENLQYSFLRQLFEDQLFHGDVHPGNIMLLKKSRLALIDFGTVVTPKHDLWLVYQQMLKSVGERDYNAATDAMLALVPELPIADYPRMRERIVQCFRTFERKANNKSLDYHEKSLSAGLTGVLEAMAEARIMITWAFLKIDRSWATMDASLYYMIPKANYPKMFRKYFSERQGRQMKAVADPANLLPALLVGLPERARDLMAIIEPKLRRGGMLYEAVASSGNAALAAVLRFTAAIGTGALSILGLAYAQQFHSYFQDDGGFFATLANLAPTIPNKLIFQLILGGCTLGLITLLRTVYHLTGGKRMRLPDQSEARR